MAEAKFADKLWRRDYEGAASCLQKTLGDAGDFSVSTVCWHKLWLGYALECGGDSETATSLYQQAHRGQSNIPPFKVDSVAPADMGVSQQALRAAHEFESTGDGRVRLPRTFDRDLLHLDGTGTFKQVEESIRCLGQYLGFIATRPDNEYGTGPDILWIFSDKSALCVDAKTDKLANSVYRKEELGQLSDHVQWVRGNTEATDITPGFIGPEVPCSDSANPPVGVKVVSLEKLHAIGETLKAAYRDIAATALPITLAHHVSDELSKRQLSWPVLERTLGLIELRDLEVR